MTDAPFDPFHVDEDGVCGPVDDSWKQGKGLYGGITAAWMVGAMRHHVDASRRLRTLHYHCTAPVPPTGVVAKVTVARKGRFVTAMQGNLVADNHIVGSAIATFAQARASDPILLPPSPPQCPPPTAVPPLPDSAHLPAFTQHVDYRFTLGQMPFTSASTAQLGGWIRLRQPRPIDEQLVVALCDVLPPPIIPIFDRPRGVATIDMTLDFHHPPQADLPQDGWWLAETSADVCYEGYAHTQGRLFDPTGQRIATFRQVVAVLD